MKYNIAPAAEGGLLTADPKGWKWATVRIDLVDDDGADGGSVEVRVRVPGISRGQNITSAACLYGQGAVSAAEAVMKDYLANHPIDHSLDDN